MHRGHGVDVRLRTGVLGLDNGAHGSAGVRCRLSDGSRIEADALLVAVGAVPETAWLAGSGLSLFEGGVECDASLTAAPGVVAAGAIARWPHPATGERMRIEHRTNAAEQGEHAAASLLAGDGPREGFAPVPYFGSDQYGHKIQVIGTPKPTDEVKLVTGSTEELRFAALFLRTGRLSGVVGFSEPRSVMAYMPLLERGASQAEALALTAS